MLDVTENKYTEEQMENLEKHYNSEEKGMHSEVFVAVKVKRGGIYITKTINKANLLFASPEKLLQMEDYKSLLSSIEVVFVLNMQ